MRVGNNCLNQNLQQTIHGEEGEEVGPFGREMGSEGHILILLLSLRQLSIEKRKGS